MHDNAAIFSGVLSGLVSMATVYVGWNKFSYLSGADSLEKTFQTVLDDSVMDELVSKVYLATQFVPAFFIGLGVFAGVHFAKRFITEHVNLMEDAEDQANQFKLVAFFIGLCVVILGLYLGLHSSVMVCEKFAQKSALDALAATLQWWLATAVIGFDNEGFIHVAGGLLFILLSFFLVLRSIIQETTAMNLSEFLAFHLNSGLNSGGFVEVANFGICTNCANIFAEDSVFCRKCGHARYAEPVYAEPVSMGSCTNCGNTYAEDSVFCRTCGLSRQGVFAKCVTEAPQAMPSPVVSELGGARRRASTPPPSVRASPLMPVY